MFRACRLFHEARRKRADTVEFLVDGGPSLNLFQLHYNNLEDTVISFSGNARVRTHHQIKYLRSGVAENIMIPCHIRWACRMRKEWVEGLRC
jgi:hypothetical protein